MRSWLYSILFLALLVVSGCDGGSEGTASTEPQQFTMTVSVSGLSGAITIENNATDTLTVSSNGSATFPAPLPMGNEYHVSVINQPIGQTCSVANGIGIATSNVSNISIVCTNNRYSVGGVISGLNGFISLQLNGSQEKTFASSGAFSYVGAISHNQAFTVSIVSQPSGQTCRVLNGTGIASGADISNLVIDCSNNQYLLQFEVQGLIGSLELTNNHENASSVSTDGRYQFSVPVEFGETYEVSISRQPIGQLCGVANSTGVVEASNVTEVIISCVSKAYVLGGMVSGLAGSVTLRNSDGGLVTASGNGSFSFPTSAIHGSSYAVTIEQQPIGQTCTIENGTGTSLGPVTDIDVVCSTNTYSIGFSTSGLTSSVVLLLNGANAVSASHDGSFTFIERIRHGDGYVISVSRQPTGQTCLVNGANGVAISNVTNISIICTANTYSISFTVAGLTGSLVVGNDGLEMTVDANGTYTFGKQVLHGAAYNFQISKQPYGQSCDLLSGTGIATGNISSMQISCKTSMYAIGFTVEGLTGSVVVSNNGNNALQVDSNGYFNLPNSEPHGSIVNIEIGQYSKNEQCTTEHGSLVLEADTTSIVITCKPTPPTLTSISISPPSTSIAKGSSAPLIAQGIYSDGSTHSLGSVNWTSTDGNVVGVSSTGTVSGMNLGNSTIFAEANGVTGSATVTVTSAQLQEIFVTPESARIMKGDSMTMNATGRYTDGSYQPISEVIWSANPATVVSISESGLATGLSEGTADVFANFGGIVGTANISVSPARLTQIRVSHSSAEIPIGTAQQMTAEGVYSDGSVINLSDVSWMSDDPDIASVSGTGLVSAHKPGTVSVVAQNGGFSASTTLTITTAVLSAITVNSPNSVVQRGSSQLLTATGIYSDTSTQLLSELAWTSSNTGIATVSLDGVVTGVSPGTVLVSANSGGISGNTSIIVPVAQTYMTITPAQPAVSLGAAIILSAKANYSDGTTQSLSNATWTADDPTIASILNFNGAAVVTGKKQGLTVIRAAENGLTASMVFRVTGLAIKSIEIARKSSPYDFNFNHVPKGLEFSLSLFTTYSDNSWKSLSTEQDGVTWSVSDPSILQINSSGLAKALKSGSTRVTANISGMTTSTSISVTVPTVSVGVRSRSFASAPYDLIQSAENVTECHGHGSWTAYPYVSNYSVSSTSVLTLTFLQQQGAYPYFQYQLTCNDSFGNEATASTPVIDVNTWSPP